MKWQITWYDQYAPDEYAGSSEVVSTFRLIVLLLFRQLNVTHVEIKGWPK